MSFEVKGHLQGRGAGSRVEEWREPEPPGEDQPEVRLIPGGTRPGGAPGDLTAGEAEERSELGRYLAMSAFPAGRNRLRQEAERRHAPDHVLAELDRLPEGQSFRTVNEVWTALGRPTENRRW